MLLQLLPLIILQEGAEGSAAAVEEAEEAVAAGPAKLTV